MLSSPPQREDARAFILQHGPDGASMVQCMLQRRKHTDTRHGYANEMGKGSLTYGTRQQQRCADVSMIAA